jgi:hypothetical protein
MTGDMMRRIRSRRKIRARALYYPDGCAAESGEKLVALQGMIKAVARRSADIPFLSRKPVLGKNPNENQAHNQNRTT